MEAVQQCSNSMFVGVFERASEIPLYCQEIMGILKNQPLERGVNGLEYRRIVIGNSLDLRILGIFYQNLQEAEGLHVESGWKRGFSFDENIEGPCGWLMETRIESSLAIGQETHEQTYALMTQGWEEKPGTENFMLFSKESSIHSERELIHSMIMKLSLKEDAMCTGGVDVGDEVWLWIRRGQKEKVLSKIEFILP